MFSEIAMCSLGGEGETRGHVIESNTQKKKQLKLKFSHFGIYYYL